MFNTGLPQKFDLTEISSKPILTYRDSTIHSLVEITLLTDYNVHFCDILCFEAFLSECVATDFGCVVCIGCK